MASPHVSWVACEGGWYLPLPSPLPDLYPSLAAKRPAIKPVFAQAPKPIPTLIRVMKLFEVVLLMDLTLPSTSLFSRFPPFSDRYYRPDLFRKFVNGPHTEVHTLRWGHPNYITLFCLPSLPWRTSAWLPISLYGRGAPRPALVPSEGFLLA